MIMNECAVYFPKINPIVGENRLINLNHMNSFNDVLNSLLFICLPTLSIFLREISNLANVCFVGCHQITFFVKMNVFLLKYVYLMLVFTRHHLHPPLHHHLLHRHHHHHHHRRRLHLQEQ